MSSPLAALEGLGSHRAMRTRVCHAVGVVALVATAGCHGVDRSLPSSAAPSAASTIASGDRSAPPSASTAATANAALPVPSAATAPTAEAVSAASASAAPDEHAAPWECGANKFESVGSFRTGPDLYAPKSRSELPAPFAWKPCASGPADCDELELGNVNKEFKGVALDLATPRGPLFIVWGGIALCSYVLSIDVDGNVQTAMELRDPSMAALGNLVVGQGAYMVDVGVLHVGESGYDAWLIGSAAMPPATALAGDGEEHNDAISDHLWYDAKKGAFGILGSKTAKGKFDKLPAAVALVHGSVLAEYDDHAKITVRTGSDETDVLVPDADHHVLGFDATANLLAWVDSSNKECTLRTSPFALTPMGRSAPLKPKDLGSVPCDGASAVKIERGFVRVGNAIVKLADGKRTPLAATICATDGKPTCVSQSLLGVTEAYVYFTTGDHVRRVPIASIGKSAAP